MDIVLLERVEKLGQMGDVVSVKNGYARNYLLPRGKALRATDDNMKLFEARRGELEARNLERRNEAQSVAEKMEGTSVVLLRQAGETGQLYGSVNARDVADSLGEAGFKVERQQIVLDRPIKTLGIHELRVSLHPEVIIMVTVNVARSEAEAELQARGEPVGVEDFFDSEEDAEDAQEELQEELSESDATAEPGSDDEATN